MKALVPWIQVAGVMQLGIAVANLALPRLLDYRRNLARLSPIVRQVFVVHSVYIALVLLIFGGLCVGFAGELTSGSAVGRYLTASLAVFWVLRLVFQLAYYEREFRRQRPWIDPLLVLAIGFMGTLFTITAVAGGRVGP